MATLILVPTAFEAERLSALGGFSIPACRVELCGFGAIAAAARTRSVLATGSWDRVILVGLAGTFDESRAPVGEARWFSEVAIDGIGVGEGPEAEGIRATGFPMWEPTDGPAIVDRIPLASSDVRCERASGVLLSTCAASSSDDHAALRRERFPDAVAEDMEGFGAALACSLAGVSLEVVRGICNRVGDRDHAGWQIDRALEAVLRALDESAE